MPPAPIYVGVMTGTSIDGIDIAAIRVSSTQVEFIAASDYELPADLKANIRKIARSSELSWALYGAVDAGLGDCLGEAVKRFLRTHNINTKDVAAIGCHGQTVHHSPGSATPFTVQLGDAARISHITGLSVVSDFRRADIAAGGQGAPLVPPFHELLFARPAHDIAVCNIGGIANLTLLPGSAKAELLGFDTGPGNTLLDAWCNEHTNKLFDHNGEWAASGNSNAILLSALLGDPYVQRAPPKSTGVEHYNLGWLQDALRQQDLQDLPAADVQATLTDFTARSITSALRAAMPNCNQLILCGGGRRNRHLAERIQSNANCDAVNCDTLDVDGDALEAAAFGWLAHRYLAGLPGNAPSVTGATQPMRLGTLTQLLPI